MPLWLRGVYLGGAAAGLIGVAAYEGWLWTSTGWYWFVIGNLPVPATVIVLVFYAAQAIVLGDAAAEDGSKTVSG